MVEPLPCHVRQKLSEMKEPGDILFTFHKPTRQERSIIVCCPGCGSMSAMSLRVEGEEVSHPSWAWNADRLQPTLEPSVFCQGCCGWHGYLVEGMWTPI